MSSCFTILEQAMSDFYEKQSDAMGGVALNEAATLLRQAAGPRLPDESVKGILRRVGRRLRGWSSSRVRAVWYRDPRVRLRAHEVAQLREVAGANEKNKAAADELHELRARVARLESMLGVVDPAFHSPAIAAARHQLLEVDRARRAVD